MNALLASLNFKELVDKEHIEYCRKLMRKAKQSPHIEGSYLLSTAEGRSFITLQDNGKIYVLGSYQRQVLVRAERVLLNEDFYKISLVPYMPLYEFNEKEALRN